MTEFEKGYIQGIAKAIYVLEGDYLDLIMTDCEVSIDDLKKAKVETETIKWIEETLKRIEEIIKD